MKIFSIEGKLYKTLDYLSKLITLSILFIISALPIVTLGAALTALHYTVTKMMEHKDEGILKIYTYSFLADFKVATQVWCVFMVLFGIVFLLMKVVFEFIAAPYAAYPLMVILAMLCIGAFHAFPFLSRFDNNAKEVIMNAFYIGFNNIAISIILFAINVAVIMASVLSFTFLILGILFGFPMIATLNMKSLLKIYRNYEDHDDVENI